MALRHKLLNARARLSLPVLLALAALALLGVVQPVSGPLFTPAGAADTPSTLFGSSRPVTGSDPDDQAVEVGMRFRSVTDGWITSIRFYKGDGNTGTHVVNLWTNDGYRLASATPLDETPSGWQTVTLDRPVAIWGGFTYVASYHAPEGHYSADIGAFENRGITQGPLSALRDGEDGPNSVYSYSASSTFPRATWKAANYWVDVTFTAETTAAPKPTPAPVPVPTTRPVAVPTPAPIPTPVPTTMPAPIPTTVPAPPPTTPTTPAAGSAGCALTAAAESCWADRTGVPGWSASQITAGQSPLQHVTGDVTISQDGAVLHDQWIDGCIAVRASNVTIYNVYVRSNHGCSGGRSPGMSAIISTGDNGGGGLKNLVVRDSEIDGINAPGDTMGIGQTEYTCLRCNIHGTAKGAKADQNVSVIDSYLHHLSNDGSTHTENFFYDGGAGNILVKHNWMKANSSNSTAAVSFNNDWPGHYGTVDSNYLEGAGGAGFTGGAMGKNNPNMDHIVVTNNAVSPNAGYNQYAYGFDPNAPGNVWRNNYDSETLQQIGAPSPL